MDSSSISDFRNTTTLLRFPTESEHKRIIDFAALRFCFTTANEDTYELRSELRYDWNKYVESLRPLKVNLDIVRKIERLTYQSLIRSAGKYEVPFSRN